MTQPQIDNGNLTWSMLTRLKRLALRKNLWFNSLTRLERGIIDLIIKYVQRPQSLLLFWIIERITAKLITAIRAGFLHRFQLIGTPLAEGLSRAAYSWGNKGAATWMHDKSYIQLLGMNTLSGFNQWSL